MGFTKKLLAIALLVVLVSEIKGSMWAEAKEITIATPKISSIKASKSEAGIKVTIGKTKDAEGYEVYLTYEADNSLYKDGDDWYCYDNFSKTDEYIKTFEVSGTKKRTVTVKAEELVNESCKSLPAGKYTIKIRSYNKKKYGTTKYSEFSKAKSIIIKAKKTETGYKSSYNFSSVKKGDVITFGSYEQDGNFNNGQEPIEWIVLKKSKSQIFIVSKNALDRLPYNNIVAEVTWETCTLRKWLNDKFYNTAFNKTEKGMIKTTTVENYDNAEYNTAGGKDTKDKVFLLSQLEMIESGYGFAETYDEDDVNRMCAPSNYAIARGTGYSDRYKTADGQGACYWWLRSPGITKGHACCVNMGRVISDLTVDWGKDTHGPSAINIGVRPALILNLKS